MTDCIFCKIVRGELPCEKIWEDENFLAFADTHPVGEGHTLVIPKKHFENLLDLEGETSNKYLEAIKKVAEILMKKYSAEGFNVVSNNGEAAGQIVKHIHFHIILRKEKDGKIFSLHDKR